MLVLLQELSGSRTEPIYMDSKLTIRDVMTRDAVLVKVDTPLVEAARIIAEYNFDGVPVVNEEGKLVGILTEYDLISKSSAVHLPTFQILLQNLRVLRGDKSQFQKEVEEIMSLTVKDVMNNDPLTLPETASYEEVVTAFAEHHRVNPIPVIDADKKVVGVVSRFDVLKPLRAVGS